MQKFAAGTARVGPPLEPRARDFEFASDGRVRTTVLPGNLTVIL